MIRDFFTPIRAMIRKEFQQITRDRRMLGILVAAPSLQLFVLGFAASFEVDRMQIAICDEDRTPASRDVLQGLLADGTFVRVAAPDCSQPGEALQEGIADVAVVLHPGFGEQVARNEPAPVQVLVDGSNPIVGRYASTAIESWFALRTAERMTHLAEIQAGITGVASHASMVRVAPMMLYNPRMKSPIFLIPGVAAMLLLIVTTLATAMGMSREREMGTLEQVMVTPMRSHQMLIGKVVPFVLVGLFDVLLALVVGAYVFEVPIRGSLWLLLLATMLYLCCTVGFGLLVASVSRTQQQAILAGFFIIMPAILLSGVMTPVTSMPDWLQPVTWVNPVRHYVDILRGVLLKAASASDLSLPLAALALLGFTLLGAAVVSLRRRL